MRKFLAIGLAMSNIVFVVDARADVVFSSEREETHASNLVIDFDSDPDAEIILQFGKVADQSQIKFDSASKEMVFTTTGTVEGGLEVLGSLSVSESLNGFWNASLEEDLGQFENIVLSGVASNSPSLSGFFHAIDSLLDGTPQGDIAGLVWTGQIQMDQMDVLSGGTGSLSGAVNEIDEYLGVLSGSIDANQQAQISLQNQVDAIILGDAAITFSGSNPLFGTQNTISGALEALAQWIDINQSDISSIEATLFEMNSQDTGLSWTGAVDMGTLNELAGGSQSLSGVIHEIDDYLQSLTGELAVISNALGLQSGALQLLQQQVDSGSTAELATPLAMSGGTYSLLRLVTEVDELFSKLFRDVGFNQHDLAHVITDIYELQEDIRNLSLSGASVDATASVGGLSYLAGGTYSLATLISEVDSVLSNHEGRIVALESGGGGNGSSSGSIGWEDDIQVGQMQVLSGGTNSLSGLINEIDIELSNSLAWNSDVQVGNLQALSGGINSLSGLVSEIDIQLSTALAWEDEIQIGQMQVLSGGTNSLSGLINEIDIELSNAFSWESQFDAGEMVFLTGGVTSLSGLFHQVDFSLSGIVDDIITNQQEILINQEDVTAALVQATLNETDVDNIETDIEAINATLTELLGYETEIIALGSGIVQLDSRLTIVEQDVTSNLVEIEKIKTDPIYFYPEYKGSIIGQGLSSTGTLSMISDGRHHYEWQTDESVVQDINISVQSKVPSTYEMGEQFELGVWYETSTADAANTALDIVVQNITEGGSIVFNTGSANLISSGGIANLVLSMSGDFISANDTLKFNFNLASKDSANYVRLYEFYTLFY